MPSAIPGFGLASEIPYQNPLLYRIVHNDTIFVGGPLSVLSVIRPDPEGPPPPSNYTLAYGPGGSVYYAFDDNQLLDPNNYGSPEEMFTAIMKIMMLYSKPKFTDSETPIHPGYVFGSDSRKNSDASKVGWYAPRFRISANAAEPLGTLEDKVSGSIMVRDDLNASNTYLGHDLGGVFFAATLVGDKHAFELMMGGADAYYGTNQSGEKGWWTEDDVNKGRIHRLINSSNNPDNVVNLHSDSATVGEPPPWSVIVGKGGKWTPVAGTAGQLLDNTGNWVDIHTVASVEFKDGKLQLLNDEDDVGDKFYGGASGTPRWTSKDNPCEQPGGGTGGGGEGGGGEGPGGGIQPDGTGHTGGEYPGPGGTGDTGDGTTFQGGSCPVPPGATPPCVCSPHEVNIANLPLPEDGLTINCTGTKCDGAKQCKLKGKMNGNNVYVVWVASKDCATLDTGTALWKYVADCRGGQPGWKLVSNKCKGNNMPCPPPPWNGNVVKDLSVVWPCIRCNCPNDRNNLNCDGPITSPCPEFIEPGGGLGGGCSDGVITVTLNGNWQKVIEIGNLDDGKVRWLHGFIGAKKGDDGADFNFDWAVVEYDHRGVEHRSVQPNAVATSKIHISDPSTDSGYYHPYNATIIWPQFMTTGFTSAPLNAGRQTPFRRLVAAVRGPNGRVLKVVIRSLGWVKAL